MTDAKKNSGNVNVARLIESTFNQAMRDGFTPYDAQNPAQATAVQETARRLQIVDADFIRREIENGHIKPDEKLFSAKGSDPHRDYITALRDAGLELTDEMARRKIIRLTDETKNLKRALQEIDRNNLTTDEIREKIYGLSLIEPKVPDWVVTPRLPSGSPGVPMTNWSDWHYGEQIHCRNGILNRTS